MVPRSAPGTAVRQSGRYPPPVTADPLLDPGFPTHDVLPGAPLRHNSAFVRLWSAATVSVFGSFATRMAIPLTAILVLHAGPVDVAILRSFELVAALLFGFVAGAWVDRLRRRPVMIWADLGRAVILGSVPVAALGGWLTLPHLYIVIALAAILTTFFDVADRAYLPTIVPRTDLVRANSSLTATSASMEFAAFGASGFLVNLLTAPVAIAIDAVSFVVSALFLGTIRTPEPPPPPAEDREPVLREIAEGIRVVNADGVLRGIVAGAMGVGAMWGIFGTTWMLLATTVLGLDPGVIGVIAALGGFGSLAGALVSERIGHRFGLGRVMVAALVVASFGNLLIPLAPSGAPLLAIALLLGQQLIGDTALTIFDVTGTSVRQARVADRQLGRVNATVRVAAVVAQLAGTLAGGIAGELLGLRGAAFLGPLFAVLGALVLYGSPARHLASLVPGTAPATDAGPDPAGGAGAA